MLDYSRNKRIIKNIKLYRTINYSQYIKSQMRKLTRLAFRSNVDERVAPDLLIRINERFEGEFVRRYCSLSSRLSPRMSKTKNTYL